VLAPQPVLRDLDRLLDHSRSVGIAVVRRDEGQVRPLPPMVERTAYRVVQEALTNVGKHAGRVGTEVVLRYLPGAIEVTVRSDPGGADLDRLGVAGGGFGLVGLRERVELLGGRFEATRRLDGGFAVTARIPAAPLPAGEPA
jgi:signal transduction histidine kinase